jgi:2,4-dienoyl-CoA reductase-like NADH-dependent reductase (Old Yellow Enzyme family)
MRNLFDKTELKGNVLKNRFMRAATWERMADEDGTVNDRLIDFYEELAKGGIGTIITGYAFVMDDEQPNPKMMGMSNDSFIEKNKILVDKVHQYDTKIIMQLAYGGSQTRYNLGERVIFAPSAIENPNTGVMPKEMTKEDINTVVKAFANAAHRAKKAGYDGVELHAAHGYLLSQFLSPDYNKRTDNYGGSINNRIRIICEIYDETRALVGDDFIIMIKINVSDFTDEGFSFKACQLACQELASVGIDAIEVSGKTPPGSHKKAESVLADYAAILAEQVDIPVILSRLNRTPHVMHNILNQTKIEYFSMSRPLIAEPGLINRWYKDENAAKCISCNKCYHPDGISCILK